MSFDLTAAANQEEVIGLIQAKLRPNLVGARLVTIVHTGPGIDSVKLPDITDPTTETLTSGDMVGANVTATAKILPLDKAKGFLRYVRDIDNYEAAVEVIATAITGGVLGIAKDIDTEILSVVEAGAANSITPAVVDQSNAVASLIEAEVILDAADVPMDARIAVVSPEYGGELAKANLTFNTTSAEEASRTGFVGRFAGFDIFKSNNMPSQVQMLAGHPSCGHGGIGYNGDEITRAEKRIASVLKGEAVFGAVATTPTGYVKWKSA